MLYKLIYNCLKIMLMVYLYIKMFFVIQDTNCKYFITHCCVVSDKDEYLEDITDLIKQYKAEINPNTSVNFYKQLLKNKYTNVNVYIWLNGDIEIKYELK